MGGAGAGAGAAAGAGAGSIFGNAGLLENVAKQGFSKTGSGLLDKLTKAHGLAAAGYNFKESDSLSKKTRNFVDLLAGLGNKANEYAANPEKLVGKNKPFTDSKPPKWQNMGGEVMKIAHHTKLKPWQNRHLTNYDAMREGGMMNKKDYEKNLRRHKIDEKHWYGGLG